MNKKQAKKNIMETNPNTTNVMKHKMIELLNERVTTDKGHEEELNTLAFDIVSTFIHAGWRREGELMKKLREKETVLKEIAEKCIDKDCKACADFANPIPDNECSLISKAKDALDTIGGE